MDSSSDHSLNETFFAPLAGLAANSRHARHCPELADEDFIRLGVTRALSDPCSGRGFLQQIGALLGSCPAPGHFFETLKSERRLALVEDVDARVAAMLPACGEELPALANYAVYAGDGHWHGAASHDLPIDERRWAVGHLYALNLRTHAMHHLDLAQGKKEHDMSVIKRLGSRFLRMNEPVGIKVLWVWDRAGLDFPLWQYWKRTAGVYFVSRTKENLALLPIVSNLFDRTDPINQGVVSDELVTSSHPVTLRLVRYRDPVSGELYEFITTVLDLPPGVIAWLYKRRWEIEKVFDQFKNKLGEAKAWATSPTAKKMQAHFLCLTHNLLELLERKLDRDHQIRNEAGLRRQQKRLIEQVTAAAKKKRLLSSLLTTILRPLQRSVKLLRWLRAHWFSSAPLSQLLPHLKRLYANP
jgi:hypothetical protein